MPNIFPHLRSVINVDGAIILDPKNGSLLSLNRAGGHIWQRLEEGRPVETIVEEIVKTTSADPIKVEQDVQEFLEQLKAHKLLMLPERE